MKEKHPSISIIVPVYNAELYIRRCIESILCQTVKDIELILVDDGSTDHSGRICDEFAETDERVFVVHTENGGVSSARNTGIEIATGEYVTFVDADDWLAEDRIAELLPKNDEDFVYAGYTNTGKDLVMGSICSTPEMIKLELLKHRFSEVWRRYPLYFVWCGCYKKSIIEKSGAIFAKEVGLGEDVLFNLQYLEGCSVIRISNDCGYYHDNVHTSLVHKYYYDREEKEERESRAYERFAEQELLGMRWYCWNVALSYYEMWNLKLSGEKRIENQNKLNACYRNTYFRASIFHILRNGTLDEKVEACFMYPSLRWFGRDLVRLLLWIQQIKRKLVK